MIKYNNSNINGWFFDNSDIVKVYKHGAVVFYKFDSESQEFKVCFAVVDDITQYSDREFEDVYDKATEKWFKLNNLNAYEEYGVYASGRDITYYNGKLTVDDGYEYEWSGSSWINLGEVSGSSRLPIGYTEVEYISSEDISESVLGAYIDTNYKPTQNTRFVIEYQSTTNTRDYQRMFGSGEFDMLGYLVNIEGKIGTSGYYYYKFGQTSSWYKTNVQCDLNRHVIDYNNSKQFLLDNVSIATLPNTSFTCSNNLGIFWSINTKYTTNNINFIGRIFFAKVYENDILVRDFVPCISPNNGVGMYDIVNNVFYTSSNNYSFKAGEPITPTEYPKYYSEKAEPLDNLTFNTLAEAQAYAEANCVYDGMHATIDGDRYYFDSTDENGWVEDTSYTIWLDPSATNASFSIGHYWGENYKIVFTTYFSGSYSGDYGSFWRADGHTPIELSFYSNGFYYDMHNPTSTTSPDVRTTDYDFRILRQNAFSNYENSQKIKITLTYGSFKAELADSGTLIYSSGSTKTGYSWYSGLYQANIGLNNANAKCHLSHIQIYNGNNELVNDFKFIKNNGVVGSQEISIYDSVTKTTYNNTNSNTPVYHIET